MRQEVDKTHYILPLDQPVVCLDASTAFQGLTKQEKLYAYYLSKASWIGGLITLLQTSTEAGQIFVFLHKLYSTESPKELKENAIKMGFSEDEVTALLVYSAGVFCNAGNYKGFGDSKFIPGIEASQFEKIMKLSKIWNELEPLWEICKFAIYDLSPGKTCLGYPPHGSTTYFSKNFTSEDNDIVQKWMKRRQLEPYNTRCFKKQNGNLIDYEIRLASIKCNEIEREEISGVTYRLTTGDYSPLMEILVQYLEKAVPYAANETQINMLKAYIESFTTGSLQKHKEGSRFWIHDKIPAIETYIGFIETYRDPAGIRAEFEGFVAAVNRPMSHKFAKLVESAEDLLQLLPWPRGFEKDTFLRPDFTSLDVLSFSGSGIPAGINIPNYDDIRQTEGFKNVSLGNVIPASYQQSVIPFLSDTDIQLLQKYRVLAFEIQVGLHELLGHGSGKLLQKAADGSLNYLPTLLDPLTGECPTSCYESGDTYDSCFGPLSSAYEECRAEAVGLYLSLESNILSIFGHNGSDADDIMYVNWLSLAWAGLCSLEMWDPNRGWLQAHSQARFALTRVLIQAGVVTVRQQETQELLLTVDRKSLKGAGRNAIGHFLLQLQIYKATANIKAARELFKLYSDVTDQWISWRDIVLANKRPRKMFTQPNMVLNKEIELKTYDASPEGLIQSWVERFDNVLPLYEALLTLSKKDAHFFM
ncbi:dipeptidyl peptidase iii-related [Holotrichia oblita]|uniref:Dipeptidyl peptidase iii-related n=2 Tax=Holotrichia oblita TaxID=644536 RepID=A0ACB9TN18_HOLOL|nr:dipeptidyl peptidase iii-related [Holotrichia oblita]KAI4468163.1 dipeptidyl peptidase iii-related [Holotrichia oblita]